MAGMFSINDLLNLVVHEGADEVRLEPGRPPVMMLHGRARVIDGSLVTSDNAAELFRSIASEKQRRELDQCGDTHFTYVAEHSARFSVSAAMQGEDLSLRIKNLSR